MRHRLVLCNQEQALWDEYFMLLLQHYEELSLPYDFEMSFGFIGNPILQGNALVAIDPDTGLAVAALGFVFGTGADRFENAQICQVEAVCISQAYRHTMLFYAMLRRFAHSMAEQYPDTSAIQFWSPADRCDLRRLFGKFCDKIKTNEKSFGRIDLFQTDVPRLLAYSARRGNRKGKEHLS